MTSEDQAKARSKNVAEPFSGDEPQKKQSKDAIISIVKRNRELEKRSFRAMSSTVTVVGALVVSLLGNVYQGTHKPEPRYFAQDSASNTLTPIVPLTSPISSTSAVLHHVSEAIGVLNSIDFLNYRSQLTGAASYFTRNGWGRYMQEFEQTGMLELVDKRKLVLSGVVTAPPVLLGSGTTLGVLSWDVQVPYRVRYVAHGYDEVVDFIATVKVVRVPTTDNPKGIAIAQFVGRQGTLPK